MNQLNAAFQKSTKSLPISIELNFFLFYNIEVRKCIKTQNTQNVHKSIRKLNMLYSYSTFQ